MLTQYPVKIPEIPGQISFFRKDGKEYVRYLTARQYRADRKYTESDWVQIGRRIEEMPTLMYPNDRYEEFFGDREDAEEELTPEEELFIRNNGTYGLYSSFFEGLYQEFRQQARSRSDNKVNDYKAESINRVLRPLNEMMKGEEYAEFLGLIGESDGEDGGMSYSDAMILLTQYRSALAKFYRK